MIEYFTIKLLSGETCDYNLLVSVSYVIQGAAVAFGIEYSKQKWREHYGDSNSRRCPCPYLLYQVVFALPGVRGKKSVLDTDKKCHIDTGQVSGISFVRSS